MMAIDQVIVDCSKGEPGVGERTVVQMTPEEEAAFLALRAPVISENDGYTGLMERRIAEREAAGDKVGALALRVELLQKERS